MEIFYFGVMFVCFILVVKANPMTTCPACGGAISKKAYVCPHCGDPQ